MHIECSPKLALAELVIRLKGRSSRRLHQEYLKLREKILGRHFWAMGYEAWSIGNITEEMVQEYLEHHRHKSNKDDNENFILED